MMQLLQSWLLKSHSSSSFLGRIALSCQSCLPLHVLSQHRDGSELRKNWDRYIRLTSCQKCRQPYPWFVPQCPTSTQQTKARLHQRQFRFLLFSRPILPSLTSVFQWAFPHHIIGNQIPVRLCFCRIGHKTDRAHNVHEILEIKVPKQQIQQVD